MQENIAGQEIVINSTAYETRIAVLEKGVLTELYIERRHHKSIVGNIYRGRVTKVLPGMQAAFVDIGLGKDAFLYVVDFKENLEDIEEEIVELDLENKESPIPEQVETHRKRRRNVPIRDLLRESQEIIVQVSKAPLGGKGARVTSHISMPGRHLVLLPTVNHIGISKRIENETERTRLRNMIIENKKKRLGLIVRTAGFGMSPDVFLDELSVLTKTWKKILKKSNQVQSPACLHTELDPVERIIRDIFSDNVERVIMDSENDYQRCMEFCIAYMPQYSDRVSLYLDSKPIFEKFNIENEIQKSLRKKVWLKSGGYIVIDQTEALTAIDVNTGKFVGRIDLEDTITQTNLEAARVIARQIRLRDLGGIIIIDFIDMDIEENRKNVFDTLEGFLQQDRAKFNIYPLTDIGLIQITRKRVRRSLEKTLCKPCPYCRGSGYVKSRETVCYEIIRELIKMAEESEGREIIIRASQSVAEMLRSETFRVIDEIASVTEKNLTIRSEESLHIEQYDLVTF